MSPFPRLTKNGEHGVLEKKKGKKKEKIDDPVI